MRVSKAHLSSLILLYFSSINLVKKSCVKNQMNYLRNDAIAPRIVRMNLLNP